MGDVLPLTATKAVPPRAQYPEKQFSLRRLSVDKFRNYTHAELACDAQSVVLTGPNGAGKTNMMEALSMLAPGRGLRRASRDAFGTRAPDAAQDGSRKAPIGPWALFAELETPEGPLTIGTGADADNPEASRIVRIQGAPSSQNALAQHLAVSWLTPQMDGLFIGSASSRRRFVDRLAIAFDDAHNGRIVRYEKAWRERSRLLADGTGDKSWFAGLEQILAETGVAIMATRAALIADMNRQSAAMDTLFPKVNALLQGEAHQLLDAGLPAIDIEDRIMQMAATSRKAGNVSMPGPHETDLVMMFSGRSAAEASTGEQKAVMISAILAHAQLQDERLGRPPLLLLDDVAAHLDERRRTHLFALCSALRGQVWYSGADEHAFAPLSQNAQFFHVQNGQVTPSNASSSSG